MPTMSDIRDTPDGKVYTAPGGGCVACGKATDRGVHNIDGRGNVTIMAVCDNPEHADALGLGSNQNGLVDIPA